MTKHDAAAQLARIIGGPGPVVVDLDAELDRGLRDDASNAYTNAVLADVEVRRLELVVADHPDDEVAAGNLETALRILGERRRRADGLAKLARIKGPADHVDDVRLFVASQLAGLQATQVRLEHKAANIDLYAVSDDELRLPRHPDAGDPTTEATIVDQATQGRYRVAAHAAWLADHVDDRPLPDVVDPNVNPVAAGAVDALRKFAQAPAAAGDKAAE